MGFELHRASPFSFSAQRNCAPRLPRCILFFYKRIFVSRTFVKIVWVFIGFIVVWIISLFLVNLLVCLPLELNWKPFAGISGKCINILKLFYTVSVTDIITDAVILTLPWPQILKLQMSRTRKIQILGIFSLGFFVVIAGIVRTIKPPVNSKAEKERLTKATEAKEKIAGGDSPKKEIKEKAPK